MEDKNALQYHTKIHSYPYYDMNDIIQSINAKISLLIDLVKKGYTQDKAVKVVLFIIVMLIIH